MKRLKYNFFVMVFFVLLSQPLYSQKDCYTTPNKYWKKMGIELPQWLWSEGNPQMALYKSLKGCKVPNIKKVNVVNNKIFDLYSLHKKKVILFFGITGCASPQEEVLAIKSLIEETISSSNDFVIVFILSTRLEEVKKIYQPFEELLNTYKEIIVIEDLDYQIFKSYMINSTSRLMVNKDKTLFRARIGGNFGSKEVIIKKLKSDFKGFLFKSVHSNTRGF